MDPDKNLEEQLVIAAWLTSDRAEDEDFKEFLPKEMLEIQVVEAEKLAQLVVDLDAWISGGGALPKRWAKSQEKKEENKVLIERMPSSLRMRRGEDGEDFTPGSSSYRGGRGRE